jgi:hypothetical protein
MTHTKETLFTDRYLQIYDPTTKALEIRRKSQAEGSLTLLQTMELIEVFLKRFQLTYRVNRDEESLLFFPFLFIQPEKGDRILNENTGEVYTVDHVVKNPKTNEWEGLLRLNLVNAPNDISREVLKFQDDNNYVTFDHNFASTAPNSLSTNTDGEGTNVPPMRPTISWFLARKEPGAMNQPFGPRKEYKPRQREQLKDPLVQGHSVIVTGQWFDNIVQFDALYSDNKSAERLIEWFEQFMRLYRWVLEKEGVAQTFFWRRMTDDTTREWRQPLWIRSAQYYFRTEQLEAVYTRDLLQVNISLDLTTDSMGSLASEVGPRYIADQLVTGMLTASGYRRLFYDQSGSYLFGDIDLLQ